MILPSDAILDDLVTPLSDCFTREVAGQIVGLRATADLQERIHRLGEKCNQGELTEDEREDYETIVRFTRFISVLQSKARKKLGASE
jgi:hypothetical protein